jgi:hypothetical protein
MYFLILFLVIFLFSLLISLFSKIVPLSKGGKSKNPQQTKDSAPSAPPGLGLKRTITPDQGSGVNLIQQPGKKNK